MKLVFQIAGGMLLALAVLYVGAALYDLMHVCDHTYCCGPVG
jgi:hypothetical protein